MESSTHTHGSTPCLHCGHERDYERGVLRDGFFFCSTKCGLLYSVNTARKRNQNTFKNLTSQAISSLIAVAVTLFGISASVASAAARLILLCFFAVLEISAHLLRLVLSTAKSTAVFSLKLARLFVRLTAAALVEIYKYLYCEYILARPKVKALMKRLYELSGEFDESAQQRIAKEAEIFVASLSLCVKEARSAPLPQAALLTASVLLLTSYYQNSQSVVERKTLVKYAPSVESAAFEKITEDSVRKSIKPLTPEQIAALIVKTDATSTKDLRPVTLQLPHPLVSYVAIEPPPVPVAISVPQPTASYAAIEPVQVPPTTPTASYTAIDEPLPLKIIIPEPKTTYTEITPSTPVKTPEINLASIEAQKPVDIIRPKTIPLSPPDVLRGPLNNKRIVITFDGGSEDSGATVILDTLKAHGIKTTIFLTGEFINRYPEAVKRMVTDGHEIGNHTMTHPHLTDYDSTKRHSTLPGVTKEFVKKELLETAKAFKIVTGETMSHLWRAPYGEVNSEIRAWAYEAGFIHIGWTTDPLKKESLDTLDWVSDKNSRLYRTSEEIKERILGFGRETNGLNGGIILMHLGSTRKDDRAENVLHNMIEELVARGYEFVKVSAMLETIAPIRPYLDIEKLYAMKKEAAQ